MGFVCRSGKKRFWRGRTSLWCPGLPPVIARWVLDSGRFAEWEKETEITTRLYRHFLNSDLPGIATSLVSC